jgi:hypothetical protein
VADAIFSAAETPTFANALVVADGLAPMQGENETDARSTPPAVATASDAVVFGTASRPSDRSDDLAEITRLGDGEE